MVLFKLRDQLKDNTDDNIDDDYDQGGANDDELLGGVDDSPILAVLSSVRRVDVCELDFVEACRALLDLVRTEAMHKSDSLGCVLDLI
jgi:hypothetical protein